MEETHTDTPASPDTGVPASLASEADPISAADLADAASPTGDAIAPGTTPATTRANPSEARRASRFRVKWRAAIVTGSGDSEVIYHGWLKDISTAGTAIFSEHPIPLLKSFDLYIEVPATPDQKERILTLKARIVYAVYDGEATEFRTGMEFTKFASSNDQTFLATYLNKNCHPQGSF